MVVIAKKYSFLPNSLVVQSKAPFVTPAASFSFVLDAIFKRGTSMSAKNQAQIREERRCKKCRNRKKSNRLTVFPTCRSVGKTKIPCVWSPRRRLKLAYFKKHDTNLQG